MATPLEVLKANKIANQQKLQGLLQSQGGYGDRIGRGLVGLAGAAAGAFTDPDVKAYEEFQQPQPARQAAQERNANVEQGGGAFGLSQSVGGQQVQENPQAVDRYLANQNQGLMANMSPEMRAASQNKQRMQEAPFTQEGMMNTARQMYQDGNIEGANQALAYAKTLTPAVKADFSLGENQTRFDGNGKIIAEGVSPSEEAKDPLVKNFKDGEDTVAKRFNRETRKWEELSRGKTGSGVTVKLENDVNNWSKVDSAYQRDAGDVIKGYKDITRVETALSEDGGASNQAIQAAMADTFGGSTRALANLQQWANFGSLPDRISNMVSRFVKGDYTEVSRKDAARLVHAYKKNLADEHNAINERFTRVGEANNVNPNTFMIDTPEVKDYNFDKMTKSELLNTNLDDLQDWQMDDFEKSLQVLEAQ